MRSQIAMILVDASCFSLEGFLYILIAFHRIFIYLSCQKSSNKLHKIWMILLQTMHILHILLSTQVLQHAFLSVIWKRFIARAPDCRNHNQTAACNTQQDTLWNLFEADFASSPCELCWANKYVPTILHSKHLSAVCKQTYYLCVSIKSSKPPEKL